MSTELVVTEQPVKKRGRPRKDAVATVLATVATQAQKPGVRVTNGVRRGPIPPEMDREVSLRAHLTGFIVACNRRDAVDADREYEALTAMLNKCRLG
jgi:hypothetical protein